MVIKLIIGGEPHSGKSTFMALLKDNLKAHGVDVELVDLDIASPTICYLYSGNERERCKKLWNRELSIQAKEMFEQAKGDVVLGDSVGKITDVTKLITEPADASIIVSVNGGNIEKWQRFYNAQGKPVLARIESGQKCASHYDPATSQGRICDLSREKYIAGDLEFDPVIESLTHELIDAISRTPASNPAELTPMTDREAWRQVIDKGRKMERGIANKLTPEGLAAIYGTADFFGVNENFIRQALYDLKVPKFRVFDWIGMLLNGRLRGYGEDDIQLHWQKYFTRVMVDAYLKAKNIPDFERIMHTVDYEIVEPVDIMWTDWSDEPTKKAGVNMKPYKNLRAVLDTRKFPEMKAEVSPQEWAEMVQALDWTADLKVAGGDKYRVRHHITKLNPAEFYRAVEGARGTYGRGGYWTILFTPTGQHLYRLPRDEAIKEAREHNALYSNEKARSHHLVGYFVPSYNADGSLDRINKILSVATDIPGVRADYVRALTDEAKVITVPITKLENWAKKTIDKIPKAVTIISNPAKSRSSGMAKRLEKFVIRYIEEWRMGDYQAANRTRKLIEEIAGKDAMPFAPTSRELNCPQIFAKTISCSAQVLEKQGKTKVKPWAVCRAALSRAPCGAKHMPKSNMGYGNPFVEFTDEDKRVLRGMIAEGMSPDKIVEEFKEYSYISTMDEFEPGEEPTPEDYAEQEQAVRAFILNSGKAANPPKPKKSVPTIKQVIMDLSPYEIMVYKDMRKHSTEEAALHILVNSVEGDETQLSDKLAAYAKAKGWLKGYEAEGM